MRRHVVYEKSQKGFYQFVGKLLALIISVPSCYAQQELASKEIAHSEEVEELLSRFFKKGHYL